MAVPNRDSFDSKVYKKYWAAWDVPRHLYHFNHKSLIDFMKNNGFSLISKHPLFLDSYYISYLSSKYKNSFFPWINSLIIGTISNILGVITSKYSSSFYVFKKLILTLINKFCHFNCKRRKHNFRIDIPGN